MIRMGNEADYVLAYFGALAAGLVALPSSPQYGGRKPSGLARGSASPFVDFDRRSWSQLASSTRVPLSAEELGVDVTPKLKVLKTAEPPGRSAGVKVGSVAELVQKLKVEAGVI